MGILDIGFLRSTVTTFPGLVHLPPGAFYVDPFYEGMTPIYCLDKKRPDAKGPGSNVCFYVDGGYSAGQVVYYPWSSSIDYNDWGGVSACLCPEDEFNEACNNVDVAFLLYYDRDPDDVQAALNTIFIGETIQEIMYNDQEYGDIIVTELVYPLMTAGLQAHFDPANSSFSEIIIERFPPICNLTTCAALILEPSVYSFFNPVNIQNLQVNSFTNINYDVEPSEYNGNISSAHQLMCTDYFYLPKAIEPIALKQPQPLIYSYYECHSKFYYALKNSIGNASGSAGLACAIVLPIITYVLAFIYNRVCYSILKKKRIYYSNERDDLDEMLETRAKYTMNSMIEGIVDELLVLRNEVIDYRVILSKVITSTKDIPGSDYQEIVDILKRHDVPDDALQQELLAFKRYYIHEKKEKILEAERVRMTGMYQLLLLSFSHSSSLLLYSLLSSSLHI